jgi:hypothetical protein
LPSGFHSSHPPWLIHSNYNQRPNITLI